jgi:import inner membrane translocase subunit TIM16
MAARIIAQLAVMAGQIFSRAFATAYRQAAADAARGGAKAGEAGADAAKEVLKKDGMALDEAWKVLDIEATSSVEQILKRYEELYQTTDKANGGTLYLQSKVFRAREAIFDDLDVDINELDKFAAPADGVDPAAAAADPAATPPPASEDKPDKSA